MTHYLPGSSPSRHFERREDPGDEVASNLTIVARQETYMADEKLVKKFLLTHPHFELFTDNQGREKVRKVLRKACVTKL